MALELGQVAAYQMLKTTPLELKVFTVTYEIYWSLKRGFECNDLTRNILVFCSTIINFLHSP